MEKEREPGTAKFGNFINYYSFNPASRRIDLIPENLIYQILENDVRDVLCLDIGCNAGELTEALYTYARTTLHKRNSDHSIQTNTENTQEIHMLGVDIDALLIKRCQKHTQHPNYITYRTADIMNSRDRENIFGNYLSKHSSKTFTLTTCFSVTLWIHLHHGDDGLKDFLKYICQNTKYLLIEPQPFKCYKTAIRRMKRANCDGFSEFEKLKWRQNVDQEIMDFVVENCDMTLIKVLGSTEWDRKVCFFSCNGFY